MSLQLGSDITRVDLTIAIGSDLRRRFDYQKPVPMDYNLGPHTCTFELLDNDPFGPLVFTPFEITMATVHGRNTLMVAVDIFISKASSQALLPYTVYPYSLTLVSATMEESLMVAGRLLSLSPESPYP